MSTARVLAVALVSLTLPVSLAAQQRPAPATQQRAAPAAQQAPGAPTQQQVEQWVGELRQLHGKLESIQGQAMQDAQLQRDQAALGEEVRAAMERADPGLETLMQRVPALEAEARSAEQAGEQARLQQLAQEAQTIQARFAQAQAKAFEAPTIATRLEAFQDRLEARMVQVDPETPAMVRRFQELEGRLNAAMQNAQPR